MLGQKIFCSFIIVCEAYSETGSRTMNARDMATNGAELICQKAQKSEQIIQERDPI